MILVVGGAYQGKTAYVKEHYGEDYRVLNCFQEQVRSWLEQGLDPMEETKKLPLSEDKLVIITDELGCGLVPVDAFERNYREQHGRVCCELAKKAECVIRVLCGIGTQIKGMTIQENMRLYFIRHGETKGNRERRYVGRTDEGLTKEAAELLLKKKVPPADRIFVSPMRRCMETAELLYPGQEKQIVEGLRECDFGAFEYRNYRELNGNPDYQRYIDSMGSSGFPEGEDMSGFQERCVRAYLEVMEQLKREDFQGSAAFVVHGGTIMALLDRFSEPHKDYFDWQVKNGSGYSAEWQWKQETGRLVRIRSLEEACSSDCSARKNPVDACKNA